MSKFYQNKNATFTIFRSEVYGWTILLGAYCGNDCYCKFKRHCKYRQRFGKHNLSVRIRNFFQYKLHIVLPCFPLHFGRNRHELSGTAKCPYGTTLETGCHRCEHCIGTDENCHFLCGLSRKEGKRRETYDDDFWKYQCKDFKEWDK